MRIPEPEPGLVFRYDYVWLRERERRTTGKERPACLVATSRRTIGAPFVVILPITHSMPNDDEDGIEISAKIKSALGLDEDRSWVIVSEYNTDRWPTAGIGLVRARAKFSYGFLPPDLFARVRSGFLANVRQRLARGVTR